MNRSHLIFGDVSQLEYLIGQIPQQRLGIGIFHRIEVLSTGLMIDHVVLPKKISTGLWRPAKAPAARF